VLGSEIAFNGTRQEAFLRSRLIAKGLAKVLGQKKFTVLVDRTDAPARSYEVGPDGHTVD